MSELTIICGVCAKPVEPGAGFLGVSLAEIRKSEHATKVWEAWHDIEDEPVKLHDFLALPDDVPWRARHHACAPGADPDSYQIDAGQLQAWRGLVRWTSILMGKAWLHLTDWDELLEQTADGRGERIVTEVRART